MDTSFIDTSILTAAVPGSVEWWITMAFLVLGSARSVFYVPQFLTVYRDREHGAQSTSLITWTGFTLTWLVGLLYGTHVIMDTAVATVNLAGLLGSSAVLSAAVTRRRQYRARQTAAAALAGAMTGTAANDPEASSALIRLEALAAQAAICAESCERACEGCAVA